MRIQAFLFAFIYNQMQYFDVQICQNPSSMHTGFSYSNIVQHLNAGPYVLSRLIE